MFTIEVNVTQAHIDAGKKCDCRECPVALALLDALKTQPIPGISDIIVSVGDVCATIQPLHRSHYFAARLPGTTRAWISRFDHCGTSAPFTTTFYFDTPPWLAPIADVTP